MASKNLGAVIQRAISDGAFRRQLQSDPAAALRGFNLTPNEVAAIRSGDASKLMSLGVDQRVSKAFTVGGGFLGATRSAISDMGTGATSNGIIGDPTSGARDALTSGTFSGTRAVNDSEPADLRGSVIDPTMSGTRAVHDSPPFEGNVSAVASGDPYSGQYVGVSPDFQARLGQAVTGDSSGPGGNFIAADDNYAVSSRMADSAADATRAIHDVAPFDSGTNTWAGGGPGGDLDAEAQVQVNYVQGNAVAPASGFIPSDSADVQREMLDGIHDGGALGSGGGGNTDS